MGPVFQRGIPGCWPGPCMSGCLPSRSLAESPTTAVQPNHPSSFHRAPCFLFRSLFRFAPKIPRPHPCDSKPYLKNSMMKAEGNDGTRQVVHDPQSPKLSEGSFAISSLYFVWNSFSIPLFICVRPEVKLKFLGAGSVKLMLKRLGVCSGARAHGHVIEIHTVWSQFHPLTTLDLRFTMWAGKQVELNWFSWPIMESLHLSLQVHMLMQQ
jgi:hypothetical protein